MNKRKLDALGDEKGKVTSKQKWQLPGIVKISSEDDCERFRDKLENLTHNAHAAKTALESLANGDDALGECSGNYHASVETLGDFLRQSYPRHSKILADLEFARTWMDTLVASGVGECLLHDCAFICPLCGFEIKLKRSFTMHAFDLHLASVSCFNCVSISISLDCQLCIGPPRRSCSCGVELKTKEFIESQPQKSSEVCNSFNCLTMGNRARGKAIKMTFETKLPLNLEADFNHIAPNRKANNLTLNYVNLYELMARKGWTQTTERDEAALLALNDAVHRYHCALGAMLISLHIHYDRVC